jgi:hypothetical protein
MEVRRKKEVDNKITEFHPIILEESKLKAEREREREREMGQFWNLK